MRKELRTFTETDTESFELTVTQVEDNITATVVATVHGVESVNRSFTAEGETAEDALADFLLQAAQDHMAAQKSDTATLQ